MRIETAPRAYSASSPLTELLRVDRFQVPLDRDLDEQTSKLARSFNLTPDLGDQRAAAQTFVEALGPERSSLFGQLPIVDEISKASEHPLQEPTRLNIAAADLPQGSAVSRGCSLREANESAFRDYIGSGSQKSKSLACRMVCYLLEKSPKAGCQKPAWSYASP